jgi:hypothetical protein
VQLAYLLAVAFQIWMLIDAIRRKVDFWWFLIIIFLFPPFGALVYFLMVKLQDYDLGRLRRAVSGGPSQSIAELSYRAQETPSVSNKLALADALAGVERYGEATDVYRDVLRKDVENKQALYGLARSLLGVNRPAEACEPLQKLLEVDNAYGDYGAALDYAEALWQSDQRDEAVELLWGLVGVSSRINHRVALAHYLTLSDKRGPARDQLELALREFEHGPAFVKRRDRKWAERAERMLRELPSSRELSS